MDNRVTYYTDHCEIQLSLTWEQAVDFLPVMQHLTNQLQERVLKFQKFNTQYERINSYTDERYDDEVMRMRKLVIEADRFVRRLKREEGLKTEAAETRAAHRFNINKQALHTLLVAYRRQTKERMLARRDSQIIHLYLVGCTQKDIAKALNCSQGTVSHAVARNENLLDDLRLLKGLRGLPKPTRTMEQILAVKNADYGEAEKALQALAEKQRLAERKKLHKAIGVQAYRAYRQLAVKSDAIRKTFEQEWAERYKLDPVYINHLIRLRRNKVKAYIDKRNMATLVRMNDQHMTNTAIARKLKVSVRTVQRLQKELKQQIREAYHG